MTAPIAINSGFSVTTTRPMCWARSGSKLIGVSGLGPGVIWDSSSSGDSASSGYVVRADQLGLTAPAIPYVELPTALDFSWYGITAGAATAGSYQCAYRGVDSSHDPVATPLSEAYAIQAVDGSAFLWSQFGGFTWGTGPRCKYVELWRSTANEEETLYLIAKLQRAGTGVAASTTVTMQGHQAGLKAGARIGIGGTLYTVRTAFQQRGTWTITLNTAPGNGAVTWSLDSFMDIESDNTLNSNLAADIATSLRLFNPDGTDNARRQVPPPTWTPYVAVYKNRTFYCGYARYSTGTAAWGGDTDNAAALVFTGGNSTDLTNLRLMPHSGTPTLTGTTTSTTTTTTITDSAAQFRNNVEHGARLTVTGYATATGSGSVYVASVSDNGQTITFYPPFTTGGSSGVVQSGAAYSIVGVVRNNPAVNLGCPYWLWINNSTETGGLPVNSMYSGNVYLDKPVAATSSFSGSTFVMAPDPAERNNIYFSEEDEPESVPRTNVITVQDNLSLDDEITGMLPFGSYIYILKSRSMYKLSFAQQALFDGAVTPVASRGCINQRCAVAYENRCYFLDQRGVWTLGNGPEHISVPIQNLFSDGTIDWSKSDWFFAEADPNEETIRWFVTYTTDTTTRPTRWIEFSFRSKEWYTGSTTSQLGGAAITQISGRDRLVVGAEREVYLMGEGAFDHYGSLAQGTATSGTTTTIVNSGNPFASVPVGAPVAIRSGTNKHQVRKVTAVAAATLTVSPAFSSAIDSTSVYIVGGIPWNWKSWFFEWEDQDKGNSHNPLSSKEMDRSAILAYQPTTAAAWCDLRVYEDFSATASNVAYALGDQGRSFTTTAGSPDVVFNLKSDWSALNPSGLAIGQEKFPLSGRVPEVGHGSRRAAVEIRGVQAEELVKLYSLEITGVKEVTP